MLVGITGTEGSGRKTAVEYFKRQGFEFVEFESYEIDALVHRWRDKLVTLIPNTQGGVVSKRPWFLHLNLVRYPLGKSDLEMMVANTRTAHINLVNDYASVAEFETRLYELDVLNMERVRPSWDTYFMTMAELAAQRANCMKRRVGCVLVRDRRVVSTGYNGTPSGTLNCSEGGCPRCNSGSRGGAALQTCLCLHAEENALLEAGRVRATGGILYSNTCPCLTCSIKIVQMGITQVVYSQAYSMDSESAGVLERGGVELRKFDGTYANLK